MRTRLALAAALAVIVFESLGVQGAQAQWASSGTAYCTATGDQLRPAFCRSGGGTIMAWGDSRPAPYTFDLYAQRVNSDGFPQWTADGVPVCTFSGDQVFPAIAPDGAGGAIIVWEDFRSGNGDVYAQRLDAAGNRLWAVDGVPLCVNSASQSVLRIVSDGAGGAIVAWEDFRSGSGDIYGQRVNASGAVLWTANGFGICTAAEDQFTPQMIQDNVGGAILTWFDGRSFDFDIYAQRVNPATGAGLWTANGVGVCLAAGSEQNPVLAPDSANGAIVAWEDFRDDVISFDVYAQRVNFNGVRVWTTDGVPLCSDPREQLTPVIASDGAGGAIVAWEDDRDPRPDIYAQRVNQAGVAQWTTDGVAVCAVNGTQQSPEIVPDAAGGAIIVWEDLRLSIFNTDLYGQRVNSGGAVQWTPGGVALTAAGGDQVDHAVLVDGLGGAFAVWEDGRGGMSSDIYGQRVSSGGVVAPTVGVPDRDAASFGLLAIQPNPCRARTTVRFALPVAQAVTSEVFDLRGRRVRDLARGAWLSAGAHALSWDARDDRGEPVAGGIYWLRLSGASGSATSKVTVLP